MFAIFRINEFVENESKMTDKEPFSPKRGCFAYFMYGVLAKQ
jgi:hypothetical protein